MSTAIRMIIIVVCMSSIAASTGYSLFYYLGFSMREAIIVGAIVFCLLIVVHSSYVLQRRLQNLKSHFRDINRFEADISKRLKQLENQPTPAFGEIKQIAANSDSGGGHKESRMGTSSANNSMGLLKELSSARQERRNAMRENPIETDGDKRSTDNIVTLNSHKETRKSAPSVSSSNSSASVSGFKIKPSQLTKALKKNGIELFLQPVMELPGRSIRYFEAFVRLRIGDNLFSSKQFLPVAKNSGQVAQIDLLSLELTFKVVRGLQRQDNEYPVFWNIASQTLGNAKIFNEILEQLRANQPLNHQLICEISHNTFRKLNTLQRDNLACVRDLGYKLSLDGISSDGFEGKSIDAIVESRQFSVLKVPAIELMRIGDGDISNFAAHIVPFATKNSITVIASDLENEAQSVAMIDADIYLAQGDVLMPAKALKKEFG